MTNIGIVQKTRLGLMSLLIALSLLVSALPVSAGYKNVGYDFLDPSNITWEQSIRVRVPIGGGGVQLGITWE
jgi:hypothetical protein